MGKYGYIFRGTPSTAGTGVNTTRLALAGGGTGSIEWRVGSGEEFHARKIVVTATSTNFTIHFVDSNGVTYDDTIHGASLGTNTDPTILPVTIVIRGQTSLVATIVDLSGAANNIGITLIGHKITGLKVTPEARRVLY